MKNKISFIILATSILILMLSVFSYHESKGKLSIECYFDTDYDFTKNNRKVIFDVSQSLRLDSLSAGYLIVDGVVNVGGVQKQVNRTITLSNGRHSNNGTFLYHIARIEKTGKDNLDDNTFLLYLTEFTAEPDTFRVDINPIDSQTYLLGGPFSYFSTCMK